MTVTLTSRVEDDLAKLIDDISRREGMDRSTVIRRFLSKAARDWLIEDSLKEYSEGKITLWMAAQRCGLSLWEMVEEARKREAEAPYSAEELKKDLKLIGEG